MSTIDHFKPVYHDLAQANLGLCYESGLLNVLKLSGINAQLVLGSAAMIAAYQFLARRRYFINNDWLPGDWIAKADFR